MGFEYLGLSEQLLAAIADAGYTEPTPIQAKAIPAVLQGRDILGIAQTGTGKTASFTLPLIDILSEGRARARMPRTLILEPTRELAAQVAESFEKYGKNSKLTMALLIGGVAFAEQEKLLDRGVDVLIATPGRLIDHLERGRVMLTGTEILVVDEADRMLDMGFIPDVEKICKLMPPRLQSLFFSATMPKEVKRLTDQFLKDPKEITVSSPKSTAVTITQKLVRVASDDKTKRAALRHLIKTNDVKNGIIFCNRKSDVKVVAKSLAVHGFSVAEIHGDLPQSTRTETLAKYKAGDIQLLVASDVAARGLDVSNISHVFNYDIPRNPEDYIHRIGRTGRAGKEGWSFSLTTPRDKKYLDALQKMLGTDIPVEDLEGFDAPATRERRPRASEGSRDRKPSAASGEKRAPGRREPAEKKETSERKEPSTRREPSPRREAPGRREASERREPRESGKPVVGMGDHVPAFLLRDEK